MGVNSGFLPGLSPYPIWINIDVTRGDAVVLGIVAAVPTCSPVDMGAGQKVLAMRKRAGAWR